MELVYGLVRRSSYAAMAFGVVSYAGKEHYNNIGAGGWVQEGQLDSNNRKTATIVRGAHYT
eukprot:4345156-Pyramimonas_sp.AAC.3